MLLLWSIQTVASGLPKKMKLLKHRISRLFKGGKEGEKERRKKVRIYRRRQRITTYRT